jgi:hypothetical protein
LFKNEKKRWTFLALQAKEKVRRGFYLDLIDKKSYFKIIL